MGEISDLMVDGEICEGCGMELDGEAPGYPRRCGGCGGNNFSGFSSGEMSDKKERNRAWSTKHLEDKKISFSSHNNGMHLVVTGKHETVDFWPTTGRWISRKSGRGRGVKELVNHLEGKTDGNA